MREEIRGDGEASWEYLFLYIYDALAIQEYGYKEIEEIGKYFRVKEGSKSPPKLFLAANLSSMALPNRGLAHTMSSIQYIQEAIKGVVETLSQTTRKSTNAKTPITNG